MTPTRYSAEIWEIVDPESPSECTRTHVFPTEWSAKGWATKAANANDHVCWIRVCQEQRVDHGVRYTWHRTGRAYDKAPEEPSWTRNDVESELPS